MTKIEKIIDKLDTREVARFYSIKVNSKDMACCPFHKEKHPSMKVYKDGFKCFACGEYGDTVDLVKKLFNLDTVKAITKLDKDYNLGLGKPLTLNEQKEIIREMKINKAKNEFSKEKEKEVNKAREQYSKEMQRLNEAINKTTSEELKKAYKKRSDKLTEILDRDLEGNSEDLLFFYYKEKKDGIQL